MKRKARLMTLFNKQAGCCAYCGEVMEIDTCNKPMSATIDHIIPRSKGGKDEIFNLVAACRQCNTEKGNMPLVDFIQIRQPLRSLVA